MKRFAALLAIVCLGCAVDVVETEEVGEDEESIILWCDDGNPCTDDRLISGINGSFCAYSPKDQSTECGDEMVCNTETQCVSACNNGDGCPDGYGCGNGECRVTCPGVTQGNLCPGGGQMFCYDGLCY